jgi:hypothetical protein
MQIDLTIDGETHTENVDLDVSGLSMRQAVKLEKVLGKDQCGRLLSGDESVSRLPSTIQAIVYVHLSAKFPTLGIDDFDFDLRSFGDTDDEPVVLPMSLPDGSEVDGASAHVDPTQAAV